MDISFRKIIRAMDPFLSMKEAGILSDGARLPMTLVSLAERHRWMEPGQLPCRISLRTLGNRHDENRTKRHCLLWYNTALLNGFEIDFCDPRFLEGLLRKLDASHRGLINQIEVTATDILEAFGKTPEMIKDAFGISDDMLEATFGSVIADVIGFLTGADLISKILSNISVADIVGKFSIDIDDVLAVFGINPLDVLSFFCDKTLKVLKTNYLSRLFVGNLPRKIRIGAQPNLEERTPQIAKALADGNFQIVALGEVFTPQRKKDLLQEIIRHRMSGRLESEEGPDEADNMTDSGLLTITFNRRIVGSARRKFAYAGESTRDTDYYANKGVLVTVIDVCIGEIEIYSTHLISGGDFPLLVGLHGDEEEREQELVNARFHQLELLLQFFRETHDARRVAMVMGDFNLVAADHQIYGRLIHTMNSSGFGLLDAWPFQQLRAPYGSPSLNDIDSSRVPRGDSHQSDYAMRKICELLPIGCCDDYAVTATTSRIDYLFVERPTEKHSYMLDVSRIIRRPFLIGDRSLSDHTGLEMTLIVNPK